jgi:hypothetical protein
MSIDRQGSIPIVVLAAAVLAIGASSALFLSTGSSRLDKHTELGTDARRFAQAAAEEVLVRITNGSVAFAEDARTAYEAPMTKQLAEAVGVELEPVQVLARPIEDPGDPEAKQRLMELLSVVPDFASQEVREAKGVGEDEDWREKARQGSLGDLVPAPSGVGRRWREKVWAKARGIDDGGGMRAGSGSSASQDQGRGSVDLKAEFAKLRSVREMGPEGFAKSWGEVSAALLENGVAAQAGCASAASDGPASVLANLGVGANLARREYRVFSGPIDRSGIAGKRPVLVSLYAQAGVDRFGMHVPPQPVIAERIVSESGRSELVQVLGRNLAAYFMYMYDFTESDLRQLEWIEDEKDDQGRLVVTPEIFGGIFDSRNQVLPFPLATRLARAG